MLTSQKMFAYMPYEIWCCVVNINLSRMAAAGGEDAKDACEACSTGMITNSAEDACEAGGHEISDGTAMTCGWVHRTWRQVLLQNVGVPPPPQELRVAEMHGNTNIYLRRWRKNQKMQMWITHPDSHHDR